MTYLNAGFMPWMLLIALPVAIHLLTRQAIRNYALPTFRFLQQSVARQSRVFRLRELILLLLRAAFVALIVMAFLKPSRTAPLAAAGGSRGVVVVLDDSLSMSYKSGGTTSLQRAQAQAAHVLDGLSAADKVNLILAGASPASVLPEPANDPVTVRQAALGARPTEERCDVGAAISLAAEQLAKCQVGRRELYLVSDFQRTNWASAKLDAVPLDVKVVFVGTDEADRPNAGITDLKLLPSMPRVGDEVTVTAEVWNGSREIRPIPVTLSVEGAGRQTQTVSVPPYATGSAAFSVGFPKQGRFTLTASLQPDDLPGDDMRQVVVDLGHPLTVVLLTDEQYAKPPSGAFFLAHALNPTPDRPGGIRVIVRRGVDLKDADLKAADAVLMHNVVTLPADRLPAIANYLRAGGALIVFVCGDRIIPEMEALNTLAGKGEGLPFLPTEPVDVRNQGKGYVSLSEARYESKLLRIFKDPSAADLGKAKFTRFSLTTEPDSHAEVLLKFEDGSPAAARRSYGSGNVLMCNFSPALSASDLARQEVFPPILHEMVKGLVAGDREARGFYPGGPASVSIAPTKAAVTVIGPDGAPRTPTVDRTSGGVVIDMADRQGVFTVLAGGVEAGRIAVNTHPDESDLRAIDPRELQTERDRRPVYLVGGRPGGSQNIEELSRDRPQWQWFLIAAFAALALEQAVVGIGARRR